MCAPDTYFFGAFFFSSNHLFSESPKWDSTQSCLWGPLRGFGEQGNKAIYFRETREQKSKTEGNRGTRAFWGVGGTGNIKNQDFDFGEQGKNWFFQGNRYPHAPGRASHLYKTMPPEHNFLPSYMNGFSKWERVFLQVQIGENVLLLRKKT